MISNALARNRPVSRALLGWVVGALAVVLWQVVAESMALRSLAPPTDVAVVVWDLLTGPELTRHIAPSVQRVVMGYFLGSFVAIVVGIPLGYYRRSDPWIRPVLEFLRALPAPAILPVAMLMLGFGTLMRVFVIAFGCLWPVLLNAMDGARRVEPLYIDAARMAGVSKIGLLNRVVLPASLPQIFAGLRIGLAIALIMMVISEMVAASSGLGYLILYSQRTFRVADTYGGVIILGFMGWVFNLMFVAAERRVLSWHIERGKGQ